MNPTDPIGTAVGSWTDAQRRLWEGWMGVLNRATELTSETPESADRLKETAAAAARGTSELAGDLVDKLLSSQNSMKQATEFFLKAWKVIAPSVEAGKDWRPDLQNFSTQWSEQINTAVERSSAMMSDMTELARSMGKDWPSAILPWLAFIEKSSAAGHFGEAALGGSANLTKLLAMESELFPFLSGLAEMPRAGLTREKNAKLMRLMDATTDMRRTNLKFQTAMAQGMAKAVEATVERLGEMKAKGETINTLRGLMKLWFTTADGTLMHVFNSPEFLAIQNEMTEANNHYRIRQRAVLEDAFHALDIPTRSEIDDAYKIIHDLKVEVRALKKAINAGTPTAASATAKTGSRATQSKKR